MVKDVELPVNMLFLLKKHRDLICLEEDSDAEGWGLQIRRETLASASISNISFYCRIFCSFEKKWKTRSRV